MLREGEAAEPEVAATADSGENAREVIVQRRGNSLNMVIKGGADYDLPIGTLQTFRGTTPILQRRTRS